MAKAFEFYRDGAASSDLIVENKIQRAVAEIYAQFGHVVRVNRKSLNKYGRNPAVGTGEFDISTFNTGAYTTETHLTTNAITHFSSDSAADTDKQIYIEGMTRTGNVYTFVSQTVRTNAANGQTTVALTTPLAECTRVRGATVGNIWVYENTPLTAGKPTDVTKIHNQLVVGDNASLKAATGIAKNNYFILLGQWATLGKSAGSAAADIRLKIANLGDSVLGNAFYTARVWSIALGTSVEGPPVDYEIIRPNSLVSMTGSASSGTQDIKAGFYGLFADIVQTTQA